MTMAEDTKGQTTDQAAITGQGKGGVADSERNDDWKRTGGKPGRNPAPVGGSSDGQSDRKSGDGKET